MKSKRLQAEFFARMAEPQAVRELFDHLPGVFFFIKDAAGRLIAANAPKLERLGLRDESELVGATDDDFFPPEVAQAFRQDDARILRGGKPVINRPELWLDEQRALGWFTTTKLPVLGRDGRVIGVMGVSRRCDEPAAHPEVREVAAAVAYARAHLHESLSTAELAAAAGVSERQLQRRLRETLDTSPHELLLRLRIQAAADALTRGAEPIAEIALNHGFCDQSAFTRQFRRRTGLTPLQFRRRHGGQGLPAR